MFMGLWSKENLHLQIGLKDFEMVEKLLKMMKAAKDQQPRKLLKTMLLLGVVKEVFQ